MRPLALTLRLGHVVRLVAERSEHCRQFHTVIELPMSSDGAGARVGRLGARHERYPTRTWLGRRRQAPPDPVPSSIRRHQRTRSLGPHAPRGSRAPHPGVREANFASSARPVLVHSLKAAIAPEAASCRQVQICKEEARLSFRAEGPLAVVFDARQLLRAVEEIAGKEGSAPRQAGRSDFSVPFWHLQSP